MMDLKFNCYDLAVQNTALLEMHRRMQSMLEELSIIFDSLDMQIKSYEGLQKEIIAARMGAADLAAQVLTSHNALDQIVDVYYAAENKVLRASEELPAGILQKKSITSGDAAIAIMEASTINSNDLVLEDWLAELVYKNEG